MVTPCTSSLLKTREEPGGFPRLTGLLPTLVPSAPPRGAHRSHSARAPRAHDELQRVRGIGDAAFDSRLAHLWNEDPHVRRRTEILLRLESALDAANAIEPPAPLAPEPIELFPGGQA